MEDNHSFSKENFQTNRRLFRETFRDSRFKFSNSYKKTLYLGIETLPKNSSHRQISQKVFIAVRPRTPIIKTLYIAEKSKFCTKKVTRKSKSHLGIGDHSSFTSNYTDDEFYTLSSLTDNSLAINAKNETESSLNENRKSTAVLKCMQVEISPPRLIHNSDRSVKRCNIYKQSDLNMYHLKIADIDQSDVNSNKVNVATSSYINSSAEHSVTTSDSSTLCRLHERIENLERKVFQQEMMFRSMKHKNVSTSDKSASKNNFIRANPETSRPGCSYLEQYSHVPETSAFQKYAQQIAPLSPSKATTIEKEHNSEQYGREFTTYDGFTARGKRQSASVPCKRDNVPKLAAERVHKIRHKLNPVRDYRLMDTVHYLAQGEFAPRDDGIKLTPSREAVLSDIIYEDVCRTHWPNTRLCRRIPHPERCNTKCELQKLIDNLLRERVAHVERRKRRHYRIVKLNHRHESCRSVGKTGDIIVASHKNKELNEDRNKNNNDQNVTSAIITEKLCEKRCSRRNPQSHDRLKFSNIHHNRNYQPNYCLPGTSNGGSCSSKIKSSAYCYHTSNHLSTETNLDEKIANQDSTNNCIVSSSRVQAKKPRLVVKKEISRRKHSSKEGPDLEHFIVLPTLVVRTPSNVKRQKKFNELYRRILNVQMSNGKETEQIAKKDSNTYIKKKDVGININITTSEFSTETTPNF